jgi:hypothetical protein
MNYKIKYKKYKNKYLHLQSGGSLEEEIAILQEKINIQQKLLQSKMDESLELSLRIEILNKETDDIKLILQKFSLDLNEKNRLSKLKLITTDLDIPVVRTLIPGVMVPNTINKDGSIVSNVTNLFSDDAVIVIASSSDIKKNIEYKYKISEYKGSNDKIDTNIWYKTEQTTWRLQTVHKFYLPLGKMTVIGKTINKDTGEEKESLPVNFLVQGGGA